MIEKERLNADEIRILKEFLEEYLHLKGINPRKPFRCFSKTHEDKHPSMSFYSKANICKCFACGEKYDIFKLVGQEYGIEEREQQILKTKELYENRELIKDINDGIYSQKNTSIKLNTNLEKNITNTKFKNYKFESEYLYKEYIYDCCERNKKEKITYLEERGISKKVQKYFKIGYDDDFKFLKSRKAVIIPTGLHCFTARNIDLQAEEKDRIRKIGNAQIFPYWEIKDKKDIVFIVEGEIDALSFYEIGKKAISLGSISNIDLLVNKLVSDKKENKFILMLDSDERGRKAQEELYKNLREKNIDVECCSIPYKDPNEFLIKNKAEFIKLLNNFEIKKEGAIMSNSEKILQLINERIEKNVEKGVFYTSIDYKNIRESLGMEKEEFNQEMGKLLKNNKLFYLKEEGEKIFSDGTIKSEEIKRRYFTDEKKFTEFSKEFKEKEKINNQRSIEARNNELKEKDEKIQTLSENAQNLYNKLKDKMQEENKAFIKANDLRKDLDLNFNVMKEAIKELTNEKIVYTRYITSIDKETGKENKNYIITNSKKYFAMVTTKEEYKAKLKENSAEHSKEAVEKEEKEEKKEKVKETIPKKKTSKKKEKNGMEI